ncbi:orotidine-5'-phosphate decarboxylase [bacterium]|nr:orotidine-5'-phosphate decarboxylase [bacterium]
MHFQQKLTNSITKNQSNVCVGLDPDFSKFPKHILELEDPIFEFNKAIIDTTKNLVAAYKPNSAFYECYGLKGLESLKKTLDYIPKGIFKILDAKRGDIGNTSKMYAKASFEELGADAVTVNPLMGFDSVEPFLENENFGVFLLCLTSNEGAKDFQKPNKLHLQIAEKTRLWNKKQNIGLVVGATHNEEFAEIRKIVGSEVPFLVPGIGVQGGNLESAVRYGGKNSLVNSSRGILYASQKKDFAEIAAQKTEELRKEINKLIFNTEKNNF